ncbi:MAG: homoserine dehydrogenase [Verrucomicrobiales bacterium]|nr:homoserine dehydrogenase [Verrucomicrobiota bacterium JB025]
MNKRTTLGIGLAGFGTVGSGVWNTLERNGDLITGRTGGGVKLEVARILVRDPAKNRATVGAVPAEVFTTDWEQLVNDPKVDIVVELIGGTNRAFDIVAAALRAGKPVVTGNKALLAERGVELFELSRQTNTPIHFEAAVAGGIPIIRTLQDSFIGNRILSFSGIINGTSNYMLGRMTDAGLTFEEALAEAQELGYAEADPTLDVNGWDAAHKAILLASLAYGFPIDPAAIHVSGIEKVTPLDIKFAKSLGYVIKLLAVIREQDNGAVEIRVQPSFVSESHILASVHGVFNAIAVHGDTAGESMFYGRGAGQNPTASSVVGDLVEAARGVTEGRHRGFLPYKEQGVLLPVEETTTGYYVRFDVVDKPGVLAQIATVLAEHGVSLSGTHSPADSTNPDAAFRDVIFLTHRCPYGQLQGALEEIDRMEDVNKQPVVFRIETLS